MFYISHTPHFPHSALSTLRTFHTPRFPPNPFYQSKPEMIINPSVMTSVSSWSRQHEFLPAICPAGPRLAANQICKCFAFVLHSCFSLFWTVKYCNKNTPSSSGSQSFHLKGGADYPERFLAECKVQRSKILLTTQDSDTATGKARRVINIALRKFTESKYPVHAGKLNVFTGILAKYCFNF